MFHDVFVPGGQKFVPQARVGRFPKRDSYRAFTINSHSQSFTAIPLHATVNQMGIASPGV